MTRIHIQINFRRKRGLKGGANRNKPVASYKTDTLIDIQIHNKMRSNDYSPRIKQPSKPYYWQASSRNIKSRIEASYGTMESLISLSSATKRI